MKKNLFIASLLLISLTACKSTSKTITEYRDRDVFHEIVKYDSIYKHDSVFVSVFVNGDTVFVSKNVFQKEVKNRYIRDTAVISDTAFVDKKIFIEKKVTRMFSHFDWIVLMIASIAFVLWLKFGRRRRS